MMLFRDFFTAATAASAMFVGVAFVAMVMPAAAAVFVGATFVIVVMSAAATVFVRMAFVVVVMSAAATVGFFVFLVVGMLFSLMGSFLRLMAVAAPTVMYMLFIVLFHGMSPYLEWKFSFLSGIILWCYFSILQMHRKWSMRNTLIFQVGQGETIGLDRAKKNEFERGSKNEK